MSRHTHLSTLALVATFAAPGLGLAQDATDGQASPAPSDAEIVASDGQPTGEAISAISATPEQDQAVGQSFRVDFADLPEPYPGPPVANAPLRATEVPEELSLPEGFTATLFARGPEGPRQGHVLPNGDLLVSMQEGGYIALLRDTDQDGEADIISRAFEPFTGPYGITHRDWTGEGDFDYEILIADLEGIWSQPYKTPNIRNVGARNQTVDETPIEERKPLYDFSGQSLLTESGVFGEMTGHVNRDIEIGPDGRLYVGVGSLGNISVEPEPKATIQSFAADGSNQRTLVTGVRNPAGLDVHPETGEVFAVVQERDGAGDNLVPDYLIRVDEDEFFGWPYSYMGSNPQPGFAQLEPELVESAEVPDLIFNPHSAAMDLAFYDGEMFPERFRDGAFVALKGSWNRTQPTGYKVVFAPFSDGMPDGTYENFLTGFWSRGTDRAEVWGRPSDVTVAPDGALYVIDDTGGTIWRVTYDGGADTNATETGESADPQN
ncbi:PQQ-dependent sugar dehydrogenase [uncultured Jannaschia sp.]|uniref:PQQ-dependent sugar dehydrogenase n=1 Tax=uncultured Jannaschia sp. TaxID=293347 RepID=UPI00263057AC|nr:PQQ-dependent sugar dehydrogenase [uncultured Jannaschia sp.]